MTPPLPPNPMTITPPVKMILTEEGVYMKFRGRTLDDTLFDDVRAELQNLRDWDNYFRATDPQRESAKRALHRILDQER